MKAVRMVALLLVFLLAFSVLAACGKEDSKDNADNEKTDEKVDVPNLNPTGYPIVNEKITIKMMGVDKPSPDRKWEDNRFFKRMEEMTNIHFEFFQYVAQTYNEKKNLAFASGDLPDVFFKGRLTAQDEMMYGEQGILIPLEDIIDKYAPNISSLFEEHPNIPKGVTLPSGHIVALPSVPEPGSIGHIYINKKWMDQLGIAEPETLDDFYKMLKAFKEKDPNGNGKPDEIPLSLVGVGQLKIFLSPWGLLFNPANVFVDDNDKVVFSPIQPGFKEAMHYMKKLFDEKLLDNETFTQNFQQQTAKGKAEEELLGAFQNSGAFGRVGEIRNFDYITMIPLKGPAGKQIWTGRENFARGTFAITNKCKHPEAMIRWVDYLYSEEGSILAWSGVEGEEYKVNEDGSWNWILEEGQEQSDVRNPGTIQGASQFPHRKEFKFWRKLDNKAEASLWPMRSRIHPYDKTPYPHVYFSKERQKQANTLNADIGGYVDQMMARFITGDASIDGEWDNYVSMLENMGVEELVKIYQDTYDEFIK